jgi:rod shape-determining protein MreC
MRHFFSAKVRVVLILAVVLAIALTVIGSLTGLAIPDMLVQGVLTPLRTGVSRLRDGAEQYYSYMFRYEALEAENAALKEELANLQADARSADSLARENERLRDALNMLATHEDYDLVDSYIIARNSVDWNSTLTINRGKNAGVEEGMCAITANHELVGVVSEVGSNYAVIKTIMDSSLQISASLSSTGNNGQVRGSYTSGHEDLLRMDYLDSSSVIRNNDQVVTTGSTVYPRDLVVGYVVDADFDATGVAKFALLQPAANVDTLEQLFILTNYNAG